MNQNAGEQRWTAGRTSNITGQIQKERTGVMRVAARDKRYQGPYRRSSSRLLRSMGLVAILEETAGVSADPLKLDQVFGGGGPGPRSCWT